LFVDECLEELDGPSEWTTWYRDRWVEDRIVVESATQTLPEEHCFA